MPPSISIRWISRLASFGGIFAEDTVYAPGYSDNGFRTVQKNMSQQDVLKILGKPLEEVWVYENIDTREVTIWFDEKEIIFRIFPDDAGIGMFPIQKGMRKEEVLNALKNPTTQNWNYSKSPGDTHFRIRTIVLKNEIVTEKFHDFYVD